MKPKNVKVLFALAASVALLGCGSQAPDSFFSAGREQYIWASSPSPDASQPRYFRKTFALASRPATATMYVFGPYNGDVFLNSVKVDSFALVGPVLTHARPLRIVDVSSYLVAGQNHLEISASAGEELSVKIVPAAEAMNLPPLIASDSSWQSSDDSVTWTQAAVVGPMEGDTSRFKDNFDLNLYRWPGYMGMNALLDHAIVPPVARLQNDSQTTTFDFGREISGRLRFCSTAAQAIRVHMNFGESPEEATPSLSYLATQDLLIPAGVPAYGPLTAFRYAQVQVDPPNAPGLLHITADKVFRDLPLRAELEGPDTELEEIWATSVYTAQLGMQTEFWDAPKRDRNPFAGDLFVSARAARTAFGHATDSIVKDTLADLLHRVCITEGIPIFGPDINCISSYNAWWVLDFADLYRFTRDSQYLRSRRDDLVSVLNRMESQVANGVYVQDHSVFTFADWAPGMYEFPNATAPDAEAITAMVYSMAFRAAATLFADMADVPAAAHYTELADQMKASIRAQYLLSSGTFGSRLQTNAMAVFSGIADPTEYEAIYSRVLFNAATQQITPYFTYFVLEALKTTEHPKDSIVLIKQIWGGMLRAGATSFWEMDPPGCAQQSDFHQCLQNSANLLSNAGSRLTTSLAHAWSSGPAAYLMERSPSKQTLTLFPATFTITLDCLACMYSAERPAIVARPSMRFP